MKSNTKTLSSRLILAALFMGLSSCANPFNLKAINEVIAEIPAFFGKTSAELVSGATQTATTAQGYKVTTSVGSFVNQPSITTGGGYKVFSTTQTTR